MGGPFESDYLLVQLTCCDVQRGRTCDPVAAFPCSGAVTEEAASSSLVRFASISIVALGRLAVLPVRVPMSRLLPVMYLQVMPLQVNSAVKPLAVSVPLSVPEMW